MPRAQNTDDTPFRHYKTKHQIVSWISRTFFDGMTYTVRRGLLKGMKRKGGIAWLPEFLVGASETPEQAFWPKVNLRDLAIYDIGAFQGLLTLFFASKGRQVVSYEPNTRNHARLIENLQLNAVKNVLTLHRLLRGERTDATNAFIPSQHAGPFFFSDRAENLTSFYPTVSAKFLSIGGAIGKLRHAMQRRFAPKV